jgi:phosphoglycolate phosphatase-like HAD superfamily hydrolase
MKPITLITFDVDCTLVRGNSAAPDTTIHAKAFLHAAGKVMKGIETFDQEHNNPRDFLPAEKYHGSTDGLILLNLIKSAFDIPVSESAPKLPELFRTMYDYIALRSDEEVSKSIVCIPGVKESLKTLTTDKALQGHYLCGLVTGNVEGIARKKMRACGMVAEKFLSPRAIEQTWVGDEDAAFLGGFGSDHCSCNIDDFSMGYKDRGEQIAIAYRRACSLLQANEKIVRVVHVGDAPSDILAAKWCHEATKFPAHVVVGCVGVATGRYSTELLQKHAGETIEGKWEPIVLEKGVPDSNFVRSLKISTDPV